jgi:hypothetical protein
MSRERGSTGAQHLGTCGAQVLHGFGFAVTLREHGRCAETPRSGDRSERVPSAADGTLQRESRTIRETAV